MADPLVREWLADSKALSPTETHSFACTIIENCELIHGIFAVLEDRNKNIELLENVCNQLFTFYRSREEELQRFALQYIPSLIGVYLCSLAQGDKKSVKSIEVLLLGMYNLEVVDSSGKAKVHSFRLPCIAQPSIYHAPISLASAALTENALSRLEKGDNHVIAIGPFQHVESLSAQNRMKVMTVLMNVYNRNISFMSKPSMLAMCRMCSRLTKQGFVKPGNYHRASYSCESFVGNPYPKLPSRVPLTHSFLLEALHGVYFSMFNGLGAVGLQALDDAHARATYDLSPEVLLVTSAIRNSLRTNPSGQPSDGPMGISISLSPSTSMTTVSKAIITNASFRTKKLPDDIPIQTNKDGEALEGSKALATINEEADDGDKIPVNSRVKEKDRAITPLIGMISKISEKTKIGRKSDDQQPAGNKGNKMGSASSLSGSCAVVDGAKKEGESQSLSRSTRKESESSGGKGSFVNGDTATVAAKDLGRVEVAIVKSQAKTQIVDAIEMMPMIESETTKDRLPSTDGSQGTFDNHSYDAGSISSYHSSSEEEKSSYVSLSQKIDSGNISTSHSEFHTLV